jgi:uncharacterized SAM-binding protein YcdF (DUF218 family)
MLDNFVEVVKSLFIPGSATFFVFGLILASVLIFASRRTERWGKRWLLFLAIIGYLLSTPLMASSLLGLLTSSYVSLPETQIQEQVDAIVILGGGGTTYQLDGARIEVLSEQTNLRLLEGLRLYQVYSPEWVLVSGGASDRAGLTVPEAKIMAASLVELGVPAERILIETLSGNTHDQAVQIPPMLEQKQVERFILVTSPTHMRRAELSFRAVSTEPLTSIAPHHSTTRTDLGWSPLPSAEALKTSRDVFREWIGLFYYFLQGWV